MSETTRKTRTAQEKAQEVVDKATRKVESLTKRHEKALEDASRLEQELQEAVSERDYAATHPALKASAQTSIPLGDEVGADDDQG